MNKNYENKVINTTIYNRLLERKCTIDQALNLIYNFNRMYEVDFEKELFLIFNHYQLVGAVIIQGDKYFPYSLYGEKYGEEMMEILMDFTSRLIFPKELEYIVTLQEKITYLKSNMNFQAGFHIE